MSLTLECSRETPLVIWLLNFKQEGESGEGYVIYAFNFHRLTLVENFRSKMKSNIATQIRNSYAI